ncbi:MAG: PLP-dependent aspartate aminotransferase family protein [Eubacteriales bacterium]|nr:PLP-dependent aspartate aminotransferase family protein [Eubacteriales bacterium]
MKKRFQTICIHGEGERVKVEATGSISFPIYQTASFVHPEVGKSTGFDYSRLQNPTRQEVERIMADLEGGVDALAFSTGMAAIHCMMELLKPGDHMIITDDLYGGTIRLLNHIAIKNGIAVSYVETDDEAAVRAAFRDTTRLLYVETPTNPMMRVSDIRAMAQLAHRQGVWLAVDNTFLTPYFQKPLSLGADIVIHSGTKYLAGHNDTLAGFLVTADRRLSERLRFLIKTSGAGLAPFDSWLVLRGLKTLALRMEQHQKNALMVVDWLQQQPAVADVAYIGLKDHPQAAVTDAQCSGYGGMISFHVHTEELAKQILKRISLIRFAESLGGVESLMTYPMLQTHADVPMEDRLARGIDECLLRLSVGIEAAEDIIADLEQAMRGETNAI